MFGIAKFAAYEAEGVAHTAEHYWLFGWMYPIWGVQGASNAIGTVELATGALMGMATFLVTLSFSFGGNLWEEGYGFPFMAGRAQFLFKDAVLLAACFALAIDAARRLLRVGGAASR